MKSESSFSVEAPLLIGSLTYLVQAMLKDIELGNTTHVAYYKKRLSELQEIYPNSFFPELLEIAKP